MTPDIAIGSTPYAVVADSLQGLSPANLLQVNTGSGASLSQANLEAAFSGAAYTNLLGILSGNYVQKGTNGTENLPILSNPASPAEGSIWYDSTSHQIKFRDNSVTQTLGAGGGSVSSVATGTGLTGGPITTSGTIALATTAVTAGTYTKLTVDSYGRATAGSSLVGSDITSALGFTPVNKAGDTVTGALSVSGNVNTSAQYLVGGVTALKIPSADTTTSIAVGNLALNSLSAANVYNTAVGVNSLNQETTGVYNSALGSSALSTNTTGSNNTAVGYVAANYTSTGSYNSAFGSLAMLGGGSLTGNYNSAMGYGAVESVTGGASSNTGMGASALTGVTTGSGNVGLGYNAGGSITTGSNNIAIGNNVQVTTATSNNQINIGNLIYGIGGTNVGIGTGGTAPIAILDVKGHIANSGTAASLGTCGTSPSITGNDTRGVVTLGTAGPTACTIIFAAAYGTAPYCVITPRGGDPGAVRWWLTESTTTLVMNFSATPTTSQQFEYHCMQ